MAETLETATTTDLTLDYDVPIEFEFDGFELDESGVLVLIDFEIGNEVLVDYTFTTFALGAEDGDWACEIEVRTVPYPSPDPESPVVSDLA